MHSLSARDIALTAGLFVAVLLFFGLFSAVAEWPNAQDGWTIAVIIAGVEPCCRSCHDS